MRILYFLLAITFCAAMGCANIGSLSGGKRDTTPPKLESVSPADSLLNTRVTKLELRFDEYVSVGDVTKEVEVSPILQVPPTVTALNKHVTVKITDSLLEPNTTYRISFGKAVRDVHEGNSFSGYTYSFSTGSYFDSLELRGTVTNAKTGQPDSTGVAVVLYTTAENDSAIVKKKPRYKATANGQGMFVFKGLPKRDFRIYAIKDENNNLTYDGGSEMIAFNDSMVTPADSFTHPVALRLFTEIPDTASAKTDSLKPTTKPSLKSRDKPAIATTDTTFTYTVNIDTSNKTRRTFDLTDSIRITFNKAPIIAGNFVRLTHDSAGTPRELPLRISTDTANKGVIYLNTRLKENTVYTLHLSEGFAADTIGHKNAAGRYVFRTFNDEDYGKIKLSIPAKYSSTNGKTLPDYLLVLMIDGKEATSYRITDSMLALNKLRPATYTFRIIVDKNKNGLWDTGDLFGKKQPEEVIPSAASIALKAGWDHTVDFETVPKPKKDKRK